MGPTTSPFPRRAARPAIKIERLWALRARRVRVARRQRRYAEGLENAVQRAAGPRSIFSAAVPVTREAAGEARPILLDLAERLRQPRPVRPEGVAQVRRLLTDGAGPMYYGHPGDLRTTAMLILLALDGDVRPS
jgi:hypothetical protein